MKPPARRQTDEPQSQPASGLPGRSVAAGGDISGIASTGDDAINVQYRAERMTVLPAEAFRPWAELAVPPGLANLPVRPGLFVGRVGELARLDAALAGPGGVVVQAVHGLGGIGKSTLAAHWAAARASDYTLTWWITAATPADIDAGLASLAIALQPALSGVLPLEALREGAVQWLAAHQGWLLILDNVTDPADVATLLARAPAGRYLITSRRATGWHATAVPVRLDVLDPAEAEALLSAILTQDRQREVRGAAELCAELGFLPLAVEQAGAYLAQAGATPRQYLDLLARYPAAMHQAAAEGGDAARTIARIWRVTLDRLADDPLAGQLLRILAWYAPETIPHALLDGLADPPALLRAVGRLAAYSMITAEADALAMHRLVQAVTRTPDPDDPHRNPQTIDDARDQATRQLADALPDWQDPAAWPVWRTLLPHIDALASHTPPDTDTQTTADLLSQAGLFLDNQGQPVRAAGYFQRALADSVRVLGPDHPDTLTSRNNLAGAYLEAGDLGRAIPLFEQALADRQRVLGPDHPRTLGSRNNLAGAYEDAGDLGRAIPLFEQALADSVRVLGRSPWWPTPRPACRCRWSARCGAWRARGGHERGAPRPCVTRLDPVAVQRPARVARGGRRRRGSSRRQDVGRVGLRVGRHARARRLDRCAVGDHLGPRQGHVGPNEDEGGLMVRVLIADDHTMVREGLRWALEHAGLDVVGEASDGEEAVEMAEALRPDVVLMDLSLPVLSGVAATKRIRTLVRGTSVLALSMLSDETAVSSALGAGAAGYLVKDCTTNEIVDAVNRVARGERVLAPSVAGVAGAAHPETSSSSRPRPLHPPAHLQARGGGPAPDGHRGVDPRRRQPALHQRQDGEEPPVVDLPEARLPRPGPGRAEGHADGAHQDGLGHRVVTGPTSATPGGGSRRLCPPRGLVTDSHPAGTALTRPWSLLWISCEVATGGRMPASWLSPTRWWARPRRRR